MMLGRQLVDVIFQSGREDRTKMASSQRRLVDKLGCMLDNSLDFSREDLRCLQKP